MRASWLGLAATSLVVACGAFTTDDGAKGAADGGASSSSSSSSGSSGVLDAGVDGSDAGEAPLPSCKTDMAALGAEMSEDFEGTALGSEWRPVAGIANGVAEVGAGRLRVEHGATFGHLLERPVQAVSPQRVAIRIRLDVSDARPGTVVFRLLFGPPSALGSELRLVRGDSPSTVGLVRIVGGSVFHLADATSVQREPSIVLQLDKTNGQIAFGVDDAKAAYEGAGVGAGAVMVQVGAFTEAAVVGNPRDTVRVDALRVCTGP